MSVRQLESEFRTPRNSYVPFPASSSSSDASLPHEPVKSMNNAAVEPFKSTSYSAVLEPSWIRQTLEVCRIYDYPLPRELHPNDPALSVPNAVLKTRQQDQNRLREFQKDLDELLMPKRYQNGDVDDGLRRKLDSFASEQHEILYGKGVTPQQRQEFLARYGCTAWTPMILKLLAELGEGRGFVELGAGYGQWAITEEHCRISPRQNARDFVLAYDDDSRLPLDLQVYHEKMSFAHFGQVHHKSPSDPAVVLQEKVNRGRVLLLVCPTPDLAFQSLKAYAEMGAENDTVVYVGEGRGGSNAGHEFFDVLEGGHWILEDILYVEPFGSKGFEKLFIFQKNKSN